MLETCGICQKAFESSSAQEHVRWLIEHDCFPGERVVPAAVKISENGLLMTVILSNHERRHVYLKFWDCADG